MVAGPPLGEQVPGRLGLTLQPGQARFLIRLDDLPTSRQPLAYDRDYLAVGHAFCASTQLVIGHDTTVSKALEVRDILPCWQRPSDADQRGPGFVPPQLHHSIWGALCPMRARGPDRSRRQVANPQVSNVMRRRAPAPSQGGSAGSNPVGATIHPSTPRPLTWTNEGQRPRCVSDRVRSSPAVGEHLCPIRARVSSQ